MQTDENISQSGTITDPVVTSGASASFESRRKFLQFLLASPLLGCIPLAGCATNYGQRAAKAPRGLDLSSIADVYEMEQLAQKRIHPVPQAYINAYAEGGKTFHLNTERFDALEIRVRRLVDVSRINTSVRIFDQELETPIVLAPTARAGNIHPDAELALARGASKRKNLVILSMLSNCAVEEVTGAARGPVWIQAFPIEDRGVMRAFLQRAESAGCRVMVLTVDHPVLGHRSGPEYKLYTNHPDDNCPACKANRRELGNFVGIPWKDGKKIGGPAFTWDYVDWLKANTQMKVMLKGIVTREDGKRCLQHGVDGIIVSNHGGRQEESLRATVDCLGEVLESVEGRIPVMMDSGVRRGTHIFKALALGAKAVCVGRPYLWGLGAAGQAGVSRVLEILQAELISAMQLAGTPSIADITPEFVTRKS